MLKNYIDMLAADAQAVRAWAHGGPSHVQQLGPQAVRSPAKLIADQEAAILAAVNALTSGAAILTPTTLEVGPDKPYATLQQAWDSLRGKLLMADVVIQLSNGTHTANSIWLGHQPFGSSITIRGNPTNPSACVIQFTADANGYSHGLVAEHGTHVLIEGITFQGSANASHWTHRCLGAYRGSVVRVRNCRFLGAGVGVDADANGQIEIGTGCYFSSCVIGVNARNISRITIYAAQNIVGPASYTATMPGGAQVETNGLYTWASGQILATGAAIIGYKRAALAIFSGRIYVPNATINNCETGFHASNGSIIDSFSASFTNVTTQRNPATNVIGNNNSIVMA